MYEGLPIIQYLSKSLIERESIIIYHNKILYQKDDSKINGEKLKTSNKIDIDDQFFVNSMILENVYMPLKLKMIDSYNRVKNMDQKEINRPKNTDTKSLKINDDDFVANIDMYIKEYGDVFNEFIQLVKNTIFSQIEK